MDTMCQIFKSPILFTLLGVFAGWGLTYLSSARIAEKTQKVMAGKIFRETLYEFQAWVECNPSYFPYRLEEASLKQLTAALEFKSYLSGRKRTAFENAWRDYRNPSKDQECYSYYTNNLSALKSQIEKMEKIAHN